MKERKFLPNQNTGTSNDIMVSSDTDPKGYEWQTPPKTDSQVLLEKIEALEKRVENDTQVLRDRIKALEERVEALEEYTNSVKNHAAQLLKELENL